MKVPCIGAMVWLPLLLGVTALADPPGRVRSDPPRIVSSWDDLLEGVKTREDWQARHQVLKQRFLELIRDDQKPVKPLLGLQVHETVVVEGVYRRSLVSYNVEEDERSHAYLGIPLKLEGRAPAVVALPGTTVQGKDQTAGLSGNPDKAWLDQLCRRGYIVITPDHFVDGHRRPPEGAYNTARFYRKHPEWTAAGKYVYDSAIAIDVLETLPEVDRQRIGAAGHSLGGQGAYWLAAYDERVRAAAANCCGGPFRYNPAVMNLARDHGYVYFKHLRPALLEGHLPSIDMHEIIALIAPRPFLDLSALNDTDSLRQRQRVLMLLKVMDVYELEKKPQNFAFFVHGRGHSVAYESRELIFGWFDTHLKPASATRTHLLASNASTPETSQAASQPLGADNTNGKP